MAVLSLAAQRAASWKGFFAAATQPRRATATTAYALQQHYDLLQQTAAALQAKIRKTLSALEDDAARALPVASTSRQVEQKLSAQGGLQFAAAHILLATLRSTSCDVERAFAVLDELERRRLLDRLTIHDVTALVGKLTEYARGYADPAELLQRMRRLDELARGLRGANDRVYALASLVLYAQRGMAEQAALLWRRLKRQNISLEQGHFLVLAALESYFRDHQVQPRAARDLYLPLILEIIEDGLLFGLDISPFRLLLLTLLRNVGDLKRIREVGKDVYGFDIHLPARPSPDDTAAVPLTPDIVEQFVRSLLDLDPKQGVSRALAVYQVLTWHPEPTQRRHGRREFYSWLARQLQPPKDAVEEGGKAEEVVEATRPLRQDVTLRVLPDWLRAYRALNFTRGGRRPELFEQRALTSMTTSMRLDNLVPHHDGTFVSGAIYGSLLEALGRSTTSRSNVAQTLLRQMYAPHREVQRVVRFVVGHRHRRDYAVLPEELLDDVPWPEPRHFRLALETVPADAPDRIARLYAIIHDAQRFITSTRLEARWLQQALPPASLAPEWKTSEHSLDLRAYVMTLLERARGLQEGLDAIEDDVRYGLAATATRMQGELQKLAPGQIPIRDALSFKAYYYALPAGDLVRYQMKYFDVAVAASRRRWRERYRPRGEVAESSISLDVLEGPHMTALMGAMNAFDDRLGRFRVFPVTIYGAAGRLIRKLATRPGMTADVRYLLSEAGEATRAKLYRQQYGSMDSTMRQLVRATIVLETWPELATILPKPRRGARAGKAKTAKLALYEACMQV